MMRVPFSYANKDFRKKSWELPNANYQQRAPLLRSFSRLQKLFLLFVIILLVVFTVRKTDNGVELDFESSSISKTSLLQAEMMYKQRYKREPPAQFAKWFEFASERQCIIDDYDQIEKQLEPFRRVGGITAEMLDKGSKMWAVHPLHISNGTLIIRGEQLQKRQSWFRLLIAPYMQHLPTMTTLWNILDEPRVLYPSYMAPGKTFRDMQQQLRAYRTTDVELAKAACSHIESVSKNFQFHGFFSNASNFNVILDLVPVFSYGHIPDCFADLIVPSGYAVTEVQRMKPDASPPWEAKKSLVFWRGSASSARITSEDPAVWRSTNHRIRFVESVADKAPFDVKFTGFPGCSGRDVCNKLRQTLPVGAKVSHKDHWAYKYLWDMDGYGSSGRFIHFLKHSKSLIFKAKLFSEWFDGWVRAGKHYLSFDFTATNDSASIYEAFNWAERNQAQVKAMVEETSQFAKAHLRLEDMQCFTFRYLLEYSSLLV